MRAGLRTIPGVDVSIFDDPKEIAIANALKNPAGKVTVAALEHAYERAQEEDPDKAGVIRAMIEAARGGRPNGAFRNEAELRAALRKAVEPLDEDDPEIQKYRKVLDQYVIGQEFAKIAIMRFLKSRESGLEEAPQTLGIAGPPGVGKTEMARALAASMHGDPDMFIHIECNNIRDMASLRAFMTAPPAYVGHKNPDTSSPIAPTQVQKKFGDKRPIIILLDEVDKIGEGSGDKEEVQRAFWNTFGTFLQSGVMQLDNGERFVAKDAIVIATSNDGAAQAQGLSKGEALRKHYIEAMRRNLPPHIKSRIPNITAADPLEPHETEAITQKVVKEAFTIARKKARMQDGKEVFFSMDQSVAALFGEIGLSPDYGARPLKNIIKQLLHPLIAQTAKRAEDEERWELRLIDAATSGMSEQELDLSLEKLKHRFKDKAPSIPEEYSSNNFPVQFVCANPKPRFYPYQGVVPNEPGMAMFVMGSGVINGRGFIVSNAGSEAAKNQFHLLRPGKTEAADAYLSIDLPRELANANRSLDIAVIDDSRLFFSAVSVPEKGDLPEQAAYIYDASQRDGKFEKVPAPPVALIGAAYGAVAGKIFVTGGREVYRERGEWYPSLDPTEMTGEPIENVTYSFDPAKKEWSMLDAAPRNGRVGASFVENGGKLWLIGGEEVYRTAQGVPVSRASSLVDVYDPDTGRFEPGPELPSGVAFATAFNDSYGRIQIAGGVEFLDFGRELEQKSSLLRLDPGSQELKWRANDELPSQGAQLAVIPHAAGRVIGPFFDEDGRLEFQILR